MSCSKVVRFPRGGKAGIEGRIPNVEPPASARSPDTRVQLRLPLTDPEQVSRDLELLLGTIERARALVHGRHRDPAVLAAVRKLFQDANHGVNRHAPVRNVG